MLACFFTLPLTIPLYVYDPSVWIVIILRTQNTTEMLPAQSNGTHDQCGIRARFETHRAFKAFFLY